MPAPKKPMNSKSTPAAKAKEKAKQGMAVPREPVSNERSFASQPAKRAANMTNNKRNMAELERRETARGAGNWTEAETKAMLQSKRAYDANMDYDTRLKGPKIVGPKIVGPKKPSK